MMNLLMGESFFFDPISSGGKQTQNLPCPVKYFATFLHIKVEDFEKRANIAALIIYPIQ